MRRFRGRFETLIPGLLATLPLLMPSCAPEEAATRDLPAEEASAEDRETGAGAALAAALTEGNKTDRLVFLHTGADW
jgi:hypothetical protein